MAAALAALERREQQATTEAPLERRGASREERLGTQAVLGLPMLARVEWLEAMPQVELPEGDSPGPRKHPNLSHVSLQ